MKYQTTHDLITALLQSCKKAGRESDPPVSMGHSLTKRRTTYLATQPDGALCTNCSATLALG